MMDFDYAAPETWHSRIFSLQMRAEPHKIGGVVYVPEQSDELENGTCRIAASMTDGLCSDNPRQWFKLSCGHSFTVDCLEAPVACPVCGLHVPYAGRW